MAKILSQKKQASILETLEQRFIDNPSRHRRLAWAEIKERLVNQPAKLRAIYEMETTSGEPDVIAYDQKTDQYVICDCSPESPLERRNACYDEAGQAAREKKRVYPSGNAVEMANRLGIEILDESEYFALQKLGEFDLKTSSWLKTPADIRERGGAIFADRRFGRVFVYHNTAQSFYSSRGWRGLVRF